MKKIEYKIDIAASPEKVWNTMLEAETYKQWIAGSWPDSFYIGVWGEGENIRFISDSGSGTLVTIKVFQPYEYIEAEHIAILLDGGTEDRDSEFAKEWIGIKESYRFNAKNGSTELIIDISTNPKWEPMFNEGWPNALKQLKKICEQ